MTFPVQITHLPFKIIRVLPRYRVFEKETGIIRYFQKHSQIMEAYCATRNMVSYHVYNKKHVNRQKNPHFCVNLEIKRLPNIVVLINDIEHSFNYGSDIAKRFNLSKRFVTDLILEFVNKYGLYIEEDQQWIQQESEIMCIKNSEVSASNI